LRYASQSPIPLTGSIPQTLYGIKEIKAAKTHNAKVNGVVDTTTGGAGVLNDLSSLAVYAQGFGGMSVPHLIMSIANPIYAATGIIYGVVDGGRDLYNFHCDHQKRDLVSGLVKIGASGLGAAGVMTGMFPLVVAGNVIYGMAVAGQNWGSIKGLAHDAKNLVQHLPQKIGHAAQAVAHKAHDLVDPGKDEPVPVPEQPEVTPSETAPTHP
jgi:hypothetical protein